MTKQPQTYLFLHGGPGFNAVAEEKLLTAPFAERGLSLACWREPSTLRSGDLPFRADRAYENLLDSIRAKIAAIAPADRPIGLIAHSFAAHPAIQICREMPERIGELILISPSLHLRETFRNVLRAAERDLRRLLHAGADELASFLEKSQTLFDAPMQAAFQRVGQDPELIFNYWHNRDRLAEYLRVWTKNALQIDGPAFFSVMEDFRTRAPDHSPLPVPTLAICGRHDSIEPKSLSFPDLPPLFPQLRTVEFAESAHYPHLEETERFLGLLTR